MLVRQTENQRVVVQLACYFSLSPLLGLVTAQLRLDNQQWYEKRAVALDEVRGSDGSRQDSDGREARLLEP